MEEIKGTINYTLKISDEGDWSIVYGSDSDTPKDTIHNDMASLAICQDIMEICAARFSLEKKELKGKSKQFMGQKMRKTIDARAGLKLICDYMLNVYKPYVKYLEDEENKARGAVSVGE